MPDHPWTDEYTLLCEKCGYVIEGLDQSGNCPECGKPIAESLPERRVGTPWQQNPSVGSLVRTWWMTLRHPLRTLDVMRVREPNSVDSYPWLNSILASWIIAGTVFMRLIINDIEISNHLDYATVYQILLGLVGVVFVLPILLVMLTRLEQQGLRIISKTRSTRVNRGVAQAITSHGSVGWVLAALLGFILSIAGAFIITTSTPKPYMEPNYSVYYPTPAWAWTLDIGLYALALLIGFLFFETFAYLGLRRCKYANRVRPGAPQQGATTRREAAQ